MDFDRHNLQPEDAGGMVDGDMDDTYIDHLNSALDMGQPIIRCKDCKWRREYYWHDGERKHKDGSYCCAYWGGSYTSPNDFCSHGEEVGR